jgi:hypothetical protein
MLATYAGHDAEVLVLLSAANIITLLYHYTLVHTPHQAQRKARKRADKRAQSETVAAEKKKERAKALEAPSEDPKKNSKNSTNNSGTSNSIAAGKKGDLDRLAAGFLAKGSAVKRKAAEVRVEDFVEQPTTATSGKSTKSSSASSSSSGTAPAKKKSKKA